MNCKDQRQSSSVHTRYIVACMLALACSGCMSSSVEDTEKCDLVADPSTQKSVLAAIEQHYDEAKSFDGTVILLTADDRFRKLIYSDCGSYFVLRNEPYVPAHVGVAVGVTEIFKVDKATMKLTGFRKV